MRIEPPSRRKKRTNTKVLMSTFLQVMLLLLLGQCTAEAIVTGQGTFIINRLNSGQPIITEAMFDSLGATDYESYNINGPSVIRVPDWIAPENRTDPNATYYMYFAHHGGNYIRLAWAAEIEGHWHLYQVGSGVGSGDRGVLDLGSDDKIDLDNGVTISNHVASPDVFVDDMNQRIVMYFHAGAVNVNGTGLGQKSLVATSSDGLEFHDGIESVVLGRFYFKVFEYNGNLYATSNKGYLFKARDPNHPWTPPSGFDFRNDLWFERPGSPSPFQDDIEAADFSGVPDDPWRVRHSALRRVGDTLQVFYTRIHDCPERIKMSTIDMSVGDYDMWDPTFPPEEILYAELDWEGSDIIPTNSQGSTAPENVNQLRDPCLFRDSDGQWYLFYCGRGEDAIGVTHIRDAPCGDFDQDGYVEMRDLQELTAEWPMEANDLRTDLDNDNKVNFTDFAILTDGWTGPDMTCPTPDPVTWVSVPVALDSNSIEMTAGFEADFYGVGVEYYFENVSDSNHDSGWLSSPVHDPCDVNGWLDGPVPKCFYYLDTGLDPNTTYIYRVKACDKSANQNETGWSSTQSATTHPIEPVTTVLVGSAAIADYYVPTDANWEDAWMQLGFIVPETWNSGPMGLGFWGEGGEDNPFTAYNDCIRDPKDSTAANVTSYSIYNGFAGDTFGFLKDFFTGQDTEVMVEFTMNNSAPVNTKPDYGENPVEGTEAFNIFNGNVDFNGTIIQHHPSDPSWWVDIEFTGLDPLSTYSFVGTAFRFYSLDAIDRMTLFTISDADSYINNSGYPAEHPEWKGTNTTKFLGTGNSTPGLVIRWDDINPGSDGDFKIAAEADKDPGSHGRRAYPFHGFMLQKVIGNPDLRTDVRSDMLGVNSSVWARIEFDMTEDPATVNSLTLRIKYEDGFLAYVNGVEVERQNFFSDPCTPHWNSKAFSDRPDVLARTFEEYDMSEHIGDLHIGTNVLAIQGLNYGVNDPNFLILPQLSIVSTPSFNNYTDSLALGEEFY